jgi:hypothetical protein
MIIFHMPTVEEIEAVALSLPENQRAILATNLLSSLSPSLAAEDDGELEALQRDHELQSGAVETLSFAQFESKIKQRRCL